MSPHKLSLAESLGRISTSREYMLDLIYPAIKDIALPAHMISLTAEEAHSLANLTMDETENPFETIKTGRNPFIDSLRLRVSEAIEKIGAPVFLRLNSGSPNDGINSRYNRGKQSPSTTEDQALASLYMSRQAYTDLTDMSLTDTPAFIVVRPYCNMISDETEFRIFIIDRKISGICRDRTERRNIGWHQEFSDKIEQFLRTLAQAAIERLGDIHSFTIDAICSKTDTGRITGYILEINPDVRIGITDPMYYRNHEFDNKLHID